MERIEAGSVIIFLLQFLYVVLEGFPTQKALT